MVFFAAQKGVKKLIPGSLPTEEMPVKSVETPRPLSRKAPVRINIIPLRIFILVIIMFDTNYS